MRANIAKGCTTPTCDSREASVAQDTHQTRGDSIVSFHRHFQSVNVERGMSIIIGVTVYKRRDGTLTEPILANSLKAWKTKGVARGRA